MASIFPLWWMAPLEEGTPYIPAQGMRRQVFTPAPSGLRFYHTHLTAGGDLNMGQYTGEVGTAYIEARDEPGAYDREVFLMLKEFSPYLSTADGMDGPPFLYPADIVPALKAASKAADAPSIKAGVAPYDLAYNVYTINGRQLGFGDPIKVKPGERVMFHIVNGSATEIRSLYLPGHTFKVVALDGNPVPTQAEVPVLWLGTAERISAIVEMKQPGVWVMGDTDDGSRNLGMGIVVEYAGSTGKPVWRAPTSWRWDYRFFADPNGQAQKPDEILEMVFARNRGADDGFNRWTINGVAFDMNTMPVMFEVKRGTALPAAYEKPERQHPSDPYAPDDVRDLEHRGSPDRRCAQGRGDDRRLPDPGHRFHAGPDRASRCSTAICSRIWISASWRCSTLA